MDHKTGFDFSITPTEWAFGIFVGWMDDWKATGVRQFSIQFLCFGVCYWQYQEPEKNWA